MSGTVPENVKSLLNFRAGVDYPTPTLRRTHRPPEVMGKVTQGLLFGAAPLFVCGPQLPDTYTQRRPSMNVTIRIGAAYDEVEINGHTFDRSNLNRHQRDAMRSLIMDTLYPRRPRRPRQQRKAQ